MPLIKDGKGTLTEALITFAVTFIVLSIIASIFLWIKNTGSVFFREVVAEPCDICPSCGEAFRWEVYEVDRYGNRSFNQKK